MERAKAHQQDFGNQKQTSQLYGMEMLLIEEKKKSHFQLKKDDFEEKHVVLICYFGMSVFYCRVASDFGVYRLATVAR